MNLCPGVNLPVDMVVINPSFRESIVASLSEAMNS